MKEGYILTIQGCPVGFASAGTDMSNLPTGNADWPTGLTAGNVVYAGLDASFLGSWTEEIDPLESTFNGGNLTFRLNDKVVSYAGADRNIATYLFTRTDQEETQLTATLSATATTGDTFAVAVPHDITGTNFVVWIEGEAIYCSSISTNTVTIQTRGYYGTKITAHTVDTTMNYYPTVWVDYPGTVKQELKLWRQDSSGNSTVIWRGTCQRAPRLAGNGAQVELQCEHIWNRISQKKYDVPAISTKFHGVDGDAIAVRFSGTNVRSRFYRRLTSTVTPTLNRWAKNSPIRAKANYIFNAILHMPPYSYISHTELGGDSDLHVYSTVEKSAVDIVGFHGPEPMSQISNRAGPVETQTGGFYKVDLTLKDRLVYQTFDNGVGDQVAVVEPWNTLRDVPTPTTSGSTTTCLTRPCLFSELSDDQDMFVNRHDALLCFYPTAYNVGANAQDTGLVYVTGSAYFYPKTITDDFDGPNQDYHGIALQEQLKYRVSLTSFHWLDLIRYGLIETYDNTNNWDFTDYSWTRSRVQSPGPQTEVLLDGTETYGGLLSTFGKMFGVAPTSAPDGKLSFLKVELPTASTIVAATITKEKLVSAPSWELNPDSIVTSVVYKSDGFSGDDKSWTINDTGAASRYGQGEVIEIDLASLGTAERWIVRNKEQLATSTYRRFFQMFGKPCDRVTFSLSMEYMNTIFPGSVVVLSDWLIPNGSGGRGLSTKRVFVTGREVDLKEGKITYTALSFPEVGNKGWSPCVKLSNINIGSKTLTVTGSYLAASTGQVADYAGSTLDPYAGTANDRGISFFTAGDRAELILRDSTSYSTFPVTLATVGSSTITINETITTGSVDWPAQAVSGNVDLRFDNYSTSGMQAGQLTYAFIGNTTTGQIQATVRNQRFSS